MATGRVTKKVLDYIAEINRTNKLRTLSKELKKEVILPKKKPIDWESPK